MADKTSANGSTASLNLMLLEEYKAKWDYYKETLVNRKNLFDWYFKIVTIPASAFGVASILSGDKEQTRFSIEDYRYVILLIFLCGVGLFVSYVIETGISQMYINRIKSLETILMKRNYQKSTFNVFKSVGFWRVMPIILINSFLLTLSISLFKNFSFVILATLFTALTGLHFLSYRPLHQLGQTKNNIVIKEDI